MLYAAHICCCHPGNWPMSFANTLTRPSGLIPKCTGLSGEHLTAPVYRVDQLRELPRYCNSAVTTSGLNHSQRIPLTRVSPVSRSPLSLTTKEVDGGSSSPVTI